MNQLWTTRETRILPWKVREARCQRFHFPRRSRAPTCWGSLAGEGRNKELKSWHVQGCPTTFFIDRWCWARTFLLLYHRRALLLHGGRRARRRISLCYGMRRKGASSSEAEETATREQPGSAGRADQFWWFCFVCCWSWRLLRDTF